MTEKLVKGNRIWERAIARSQTGNWASEKEVFEFIYGFVRMIKPEFCLEIGTFEGDGAMAIGRALKENQHGYLWTADIKDFGQVKNIKEAGLSGWIKCAIAAKPFSDEFLKQTRCDFIWVDDGHSYEEASRDLEIAHQVCSKDGYILGHDIVSIKTVRQAYNDFMQKYGSQYENIIVASYNGIFILKKK